jgi:hypothetical protein
MNKNNIITVDDLFSYWVLLWGFLYILFSGSHKFIYKWLNPILALWFGVLENIIMLVRLLYIHPLPNVSSVQFLLVIIITKAIPIYLLRDHKINWKNDIIVLLLVFTVYNLYLWLVKNTNIFEIYDETEKSIANNENRTPLLALINR